MNRRQFLELAGAAALQAQTAPRKPNIVFILADDLGYGDLGCYGQKRLATPNLDRLAAEGTRFTQAYAGSTVCAPSRCALMTGRHIGHARVRGNHSPEIGLESGETTVAKVLRQAGYRTGIFGKWGLGGPDTAGQPNDQGFEEWFGYLSQLHAHDYYPTHLWQNREEFFLPGNMGGKREQYAHDLFTPRALSFVERHRGEPFFLYLAYTVPHANNELGRSTGNGMEVPDFGPYARENWPAVEKGFAGMVHRLDMDVGRVLARLKELGLEENTLVFFASDNGPHREGGHDPDFFGSRGPLRGIKRDLYEGGIRVPMLARWPGRVPAGRVSDQAWAFWDFLPTVAEVAGMTPPSGLDGISMLPAILGRSQRNHEYFYWEFHEGGFKQAVRMGDWKGVRLKVHGPLELYNLQDDPGEQRDVASRQPEVVARIEAILRNARTESKEFPVAEGG